MVTNVKNNPGSLTKSQQAYNTLREMIISKEFFGGNNWSLRKLAARLKMSVVPIAEGLRRLEQEGILDVRPQRGITVRQMSAKEFEELKIIREGFEIQAARLLAIHRPKDKLKKLRQMAEKLQRELKAGKYNQAAVTDFQLHQELVAAANAPLLTERYNQLVTLSMISTDSWDGASWMREELEGRTNHVHLVDVLEAGSPDEAEQAVREHIRTGADRTPLRRA